MIQQLKQKEREIEKLQMEFTNEIGLGSCFVVAGALHKLLGGKVVEGTFEDMCHWWVEKDGIVIDFNCFSGKNIFVFGDKEGYEKEYEMEGIEKVKIEVDSEGLIDPEQYDFWLAKFEEVLNGR